MALLWVTTAAVALTSCTVPSQTNLRDSADSSHWVELPERRSVAQTMPEPVSTTVSFETSEGTFMSVDVSPDGEALVFDLLGDVYQLPFAGGEAVPLTTGRAWDEAPRFSPDGKFVYFVSDRKGFKSLWRLILSDGSLQQVTASESDIMGTPNWSLSDSRLISGLGDARTLGSEVTLQSIDPYTGEIAPLESPDGPWIDMDTFDVLRDSIETYSGVQAPDGQVYFSDARYDPDLRRRVVRLYKFNPETQTRTAITPSTGIYSDYKPQLSRDGKLLAYFRQYKDRRTELRIHNRMSGSESALIELSGEDDASYGASHSLRPNYAFTPDDRQLVYWHDGKIHQLTIATGASQIIPFRAKIVRKVWSRVQPSAQHIDEVGEAKIIRWPSVSGDGQTVVFAAIGYVWVMDLETGRSQRLTSSDDFEYMPALSPDDGSVAYVSFARSGNEYGTGRLMIAEIGGTTPRELLAAPNETFFLPQWSQDGEKIAVIREAESDSGIEAAFGWTPATIGSFSEVAKGPASNDRVSLRIYSRYVGFDETGNKLVFSFPTSKTQTILQIADLNGGSPRTLAIGTSEVGGIAPAPDLNSLALTRDDETVWLRPFEAGAEAVSVGTSEPGARRVSEIGGYYIDWNGSDQFTYGFGQSIYRYSLDRGGQETLQVHVALAEPSSPEIVAFRNARLIAMPKDANDSRPIETGTIVLEGQRIVELGPVDEVEIPSNATVIDATGKTIMPGLIDTHYHRIGGSHRASGLSAFKLPDPEFSDRSAIAYGVTTAWEPGGPANDGSPATADLQMAGRILGPRWSFSAGGSVGYPWAHLDSYADALESVRRHKTLGVAVLKEYKTPRRLQRQWLSTAAREEGVGIISHVDSFDGMMTRIVDGYTGGEHPYIPVPFFNDVHELLRQTGFIWTPNIVISSGSIGGYKDTHDYFWRHVLKMRPHERDKLSAISPRHRSLTDDFAKPSTSYGFHRVSRVAKQSTLAAKRGVHIGVSAHNMPGAYLHSEMWHLWKGGLPIEDVLRAATIGNAEKLGLQSEVGSLEPGKVADLLILDENPLDNILNTVSLKFTVQGGVLFDSDNAERLEVTELPECGAAMDETALCVVSEK